jgi:hypothetical protein
MSPRNPEYDYYNDCWKVPLASLEVGKIYRWKDSGTLELLLSLEGLDEKPDSHFRVRTKLYDFRIKGIIQDSARYDFLLARYREFK